VIQRKDYAPVRKVKQARKDEERIAAVLGGKRLPASGALRSKIDNKSARGDISAAGFWIEHKSTVKPSIAVQRSWLEKVTAGARGQAVWPALCLTFQGTLTDWIGLPEAILDQLAADYPSGESKWGAASTRGSIRVECQLLRSITLEASLAKESPALVLHFSEGSFGHPQLRWVFIPLAEFKKIVEARREA